MAEAVFHFPKGFLWGTATSSHQVEGMNTNNNWWLWEQEEGRIYQGHRSGKACDWWGGRWREDIDRAVETHQNAHRFSIEWSRIQPAPDRWDEEAIDRYRSMAIYMLDRGIEPMITLHHFTDPIWFTEMGGWESEESPVYFRKYVEKVVTALISFNRYWVTINEPNVLSVFGYAFDLFPPGRKNLGSAMNVCLNLLRSHSEAYHAIKQIQKDSEVGLSINYHNFLPHRKRNPLDVFLAKQLHNLFNDIFPSAVASGTVRFPHKKVQIENLKGTQDFLGIQYYNSEEVMLKSYDFNDLLSERIFPEGAEVSPNNFMANVPEGMFKALKWGLRFGVPLIVTENGIEDVEDVLRPKYMIQHIHQVWRAVNFSYPIKGYFHWSLVDNFEWDRGWFQRFGLWELDLETQARIKRPSVDLYASICKENGISSEVVRQYVPDLMESMFPG